MAKKKYVRVIEEGFVWDIPASAIAENRSDYYGGKENSEEVRKDEYKYTMENDDELIDWMKNNMNWEDVEKVTKLVESPQKTEPVDFCNAEAEVITK